MRTLLLVVVALVILVVRLVVRLVIALVIRLVVALIVRLVVALAVRLIVALIICLVVRLIVALIFGRGVCGRGIIRIVFRSRACLTAGGRHEGEHHEGHQPGERLRPRSVSCPNSHARLPLSEAVLLPRLLLPGSVRRGFTGG